ncbi:hypothetical protein SKAU_G00138440 [Synaphobranchus kaupii]|uniref:Uncharacterized protein n=1 Tax=Synaphobranchus kaupii TaxID=118154 RepID=A0A9Q1J407_SYNKA|nr:hypothetical protein SKAU_G00138440 [Synaphobranchus kaupii]
MAPIMADFMWEEPEPSRPERGRGPSGSQPTIVYNFAGVPPPAFPTPVNNISNSSIFRQSQVSRCHSSNHSSIREDFQDPGSQYSLKVL